MSLRTTMQRASRARLQKSNGRAAVDSDRARRKKDLKNGGTDLKGAARRHPPLDGKKVRNSLGGEKNRQALGRAGGGSGNNKSTSHYS